MKDRFLKIEKCATCGGEYEITGLFRWFYIKLKKPKYCAFWCKECSERIDMSKVLFNPALAKTTPFISIAKRISNEEGEKWWN